MIKPMTRDRLGILLLLCTGPALSCGSGANQQASIPEAPIQTPLVLAIQEAEWKPTGFKGVEAAVLWGDPESDARGGELLKMDGGLAFPPHKHSYDERVLVISGTFVFIQPAGNDRQLRAGSYYYLPADVMHASRCDAGPTCLVYSEVIPRSK